MRKSERKRVLWKRGMFNLAMRRVCPSCGANVSEYCFKRHPKQVWPCVGRLRLITDKDIAEYHKKVQYQARLLRKMFSKDV
jgi:hypothetical protein